MSFLINPFAHGAPAPAGVTWNPSDKSANVSLHDGNLRALRDAVAGQGGVRATLSRSSGKWYFECTVLSSTAIRVGLATAAADFTANVIDNTPEGIVYVSSLDQIRYNSVSHTTGVASPSVGDEICIAADLDNFRFWARRNAGSWNNSGTADPATNTGGVAFGSGTWFPAFQGNANATTTVNFGGSAFAQTPPAGFSAWE